MDPLPPSPEMMCPHCGQSLTTHDHRDDLTGLDDGPYLPGRAPRKRSTRSVQQQSADRMKAWETRRAKYGEKGHDSDYRR